MPRSRHAVLIHSPFTTAAVWGEVPARVCDRGWTVTVTEVLDGSPPSATRFVAHVAQQLQLAAADESLVLVGHGAAGPLLPQIGFARQASGRPVRGYVFVDALLPRTQRPATLVDLIDTSSDRRVEELTETGVFPQVTDADIFTETLPSPVDWPDAPCGFVQLSDTFTAEAAAAGRRGWDVRSLQAHHFWAVSDPDGLAVVLCEVMESWLDHD